MLASPGSALQDTCLMRYPPLDGVTNQREIGRAMQQMVRATKPSRAG
jgi:hypothetical protein